MEILIENEITIVDAPSEFKDWLDKEYTIRNPEYDKRVRLNLYHRNIPKTIKLFRPYWGKIKIGYGCLRDIYKFIVSNGYDCTFKLRLNENALADWRSANLQLRDYQIPAVKHMVNRKFGILKAPCSSGKTIMGHAIAMKTGCRTLWLTHTRDLLNQSMEVGQMILGGKDHIGIITDGKMQLGDVITYATIQTLAKFPESYFKYDFNCVIVDECHRCSTKEQITQMARVVNSIDAEYKIGLSATPETHDGYTRTIYCTLGNIEYEIDKKDLEDLNMVMPVDIKAVFSNFTYSDEMYKSDGTLNWSKVTEMQFADKTRNLLICQYIEPKVPILILSSRVEHLRNITYCLSDKMKKKTCIITSSKIDVDSLIKVPKKPADRAKSIEDFKKGKYDIMLSTYQLAKEGLNIPRLERVIFALPAVESNIITQAIGRVARTCEGKNRAECIDIVDKPTYFRKKYRDRLRLYKKLNYKVTEIKNHDSSGKDSQN